MGSRPLVLRNHKSPSLGKTNRMNLRTAGKGGTGFPVFSGGTVW